MILFGRTVQGDIQCYCCAFLWMMANILEMAYETAYARSATMDPASLISLQVAAIAESFRARMESASIETTFHVCNILSWLCLAMIVQRLSYTLSSGRCAWSAAVRVLGTTAANIEIVGSLVFMGLSKSLNWLTLHYNMDQWLIQSQSVYYAEGGDYTTYPENRHVQESTPDGLGWKTLEIVRVALRGMLFWIESVEYLFMAALFLTLFGAVYFGSTTSFASSSSSQHWAIASVVLAVLSVLEFFLCMQAYTYGRGVAGVLLGILNHVVLVPVWFLWLGRLLKQDSAAGVDATLSPQVRTGSVWARECT